MTQTELAKRTGLSDRTIRDLELGKPVKSGQHRVETIRCLATALDIPIDVLLSTEVLDVRELYDNNWVGPPASVSSLIDHLSQHQGIFVDADAARMIRNDQRAALLGVMWRADDPSLRSLWTTPMYTFASCADTPNGGCLSAFVMRILKYVYQMRQSFASAEAPVERTISDMLTRLRNEWDGVPYGAGDDDAVFAEYILGLAYFETLAHLARLVADTDRLVVDKVALHRAFDRSTYASGLDNVFQLHQCILGQLNIRYDNTRREDIWETIAKIIARCERRHDGFRAAIETAVSLRVNSRSVPSTTIVAQLLHWDGWGGDGRLLDNLEHGLKRSKNALLSVLFRHRSQAFDWHQLRESGGRPFAHFASQQAHFREAACALARYAAGCTAAILSHPTLRMNPNAVRLWGDAVGPTAIAERRIIERLRRIALRRGEPYVHVRCAFTDISASALSVLIEHEFVHDTSATVLWRDLNRKFPGEPGVAIPAYLAEHLQPGGYDCYSCSIALHHIADKHSGTERLCQIFAFATRIVRPGGVISLPDVGPGVIAQVFLLPINLLDREGGWGCTNFFEKRGFLEVACTLDGKMVRATECKPGTKCKIPIPLLALRGGSPCILDAGLNAIYEYVPYIVVAVEFVQLIEFDRTWRSAGSVGMRHEALRDLLVRTWPNIDTIMQEVRYLNDWLGSSLPR